MQPRFLILALAGLPGTGKSALAGELARALDLPLLAKDVVRASMFAPHEIEYTRSQDDRVMQHIHDSVERHAREQISRGVVLDGRTYSKREQVQALYALRERLDARLLVIECTCDPRTAKARIAADLARGLHPAANRTVELYQRLAAAADPIPEPKLLLSTELESPAELLNRVREKLRELDASPT